MPNVANLGCASPAFHVVYDSRKICTDSESKTLILLLFKYPHLVCLTEQRHFIVRKLPKFCMNELGYPIGPTAPKSEQKQSAKYLPPFESVDNVVWAVE